MIQEFGHDVTYLFSRNAYTTVSRSHKFLEALKSWTLTGNNAETTGNRRDLHLLAVSLADWLNQHLQIHTPRSAIIAELQDKYLCSTNSPDEWKRVEKKFRTTWNDPLALGELDQKHIPVKKPRNQAVTITTTRDSFPRCCLPLSMQNTDSCG